MFRYPWYHQGEDDGGRQKRTWLCRRRGRTRYLAACTEGLAGGGIAIAIIIAVVRGLGHLAAKPFAMRDHQSANMLHRDLEYRLARVGLMVSSG
ncbi:hypothetical protein ANO14919_131580 [Xylariales sp. No.14919]|nr:hypothetical protein ANO14919_131580 [Xylariales sp. No.14919]